MKKMLIVAVRELRERIANRSFWALAVVGPLVLMLVLIGLFRFGGQDNQHWRILIADPANLMESKIAAGSTGNNSYFFINDYVEIEDFNRLPKFATYDALVEINEKVLSNKSAFVFYRKAPSVKTQISLKFQVEQRIEEVLAGQFTKLSLADFRQIKRPITLNYRDAADPENQAPSQAGWVGFLFGALILFFIFLFGMTILRSVSREKSSRIVEVLAAVVSPAQLMGGKILGIGASALIQFLFWIIVTATGLYLLRENLYLDSYGAAANGEYVSYNEYVNLVFERLDFGVMVLWFLVFFVVGYLFYGAFFAAVGAVSGSESDGQQFVFPIIAILLCSLYAGYYAIYHPGTAFSNVLLYIPFFTPVVVMVKLAQGFSGSESYQLLAALLVEVIFLGLALFLAARFYRNGLLRFGHTFKLKHLISWGKKS